MKQLRFTLMLIVVVLSPLAAVCQASHGKGDWARVQTLARGEALDVRQTDGANVYCRFAGATKDILFCATDPWGGEYRIPRAAVEQIRSARKRMNVANILRVSTAVGAVVGLAIPPQKGGARALDAIGGGLAGALAGGVISAAAAIPIALLPGKLIYRQSRISRDAQGAPKMQQEPSGPSVP